MHHGVLWDSYSSDLGSHQVLSTKESSNKPVALDVLETLKLMFLNDLGLSVFVSVFGEELSKP